LIKLQIFQLMLMELKEVKLVKWIQKTAETAEFVAGVCSGVLLLASTGVLRNLMVTTHHTRFQQLQDLSKVMGLGLNVVDTRTGNNYIHTMSSKFMTGGGVHCSMAMALHVTELYIGHTRKYDLARDVLEYPVPIGSVTYPFSNQRNTMEPSEFILGLSHINVIVADDDMMERAVDFYTKVMSFKMGWTLWLPDEANVHFAHDAGVDKCKIYVKFMVHQNAQFYIELMQYKDSVPKGDPKIHIHRTNDAGGIRHVALEVTNADKVYQYMKEQQAFYNITILSKGIPRKLTPDVQTFFYIIDPFGVQWEFEEGRPMQRVINGIVG